MKPVLHNVRKLTDSGMRRMMGIGTALLTAALLPHLALAGGQMMPGGQGGMGRPSTSIQPGGDELPNTPLSEKPDAAAQKAYKAGMKALTKAMEYESSAASAPNPDKKSKALEKMGDNYYRALDEFTEALSNKGDMVDAWKNVGYIHLRLGAFAESIDDYNHTLALKPDLFDAIRYRAEAYLAVDRLDDVKSAYMDLFNHAPPLADGLMTAMQQWLAAHRANPNGMRAADVDGFAKWLQERDGIAKQSASLPH